MNIIFNIRNADRFKSGIYTIRNLKNNKTYIGSTLNFQQRYYYHNKFLQKNKHGNAHLQRAYNKYDADVFIFEIKQLCKNITESELRNIEQIILNSEVFCVKNYENYFYNIGKNTIAPMSGLTHSNEVKKKMSENRKGEKNNFYGKTHTPESLKKMSAANIGKIISEEHKNVLRNRIGDKSNNYISDIIAENIETKEKLIAQSEKELAKLLNVSQAAINHRANINSKRYTQSLINGIWKIYREM